MRRRSTGAVARPLGLEAVADNHRLVHQQDPETVEHSRPDLPRHREQLCRRTAAAVHQGQRLPGGRVTPEQLKPVVEAKGGVDRLAKRLGVTPRTVYRWLDGTRRLGPVAAKLIRTLR